MRAALALVLSFAAGCTDPDLRPAPPRRAAFGEARRQPWVPGDGLVSLAGDSALCTRGDRFVLVQDRHQFVLEDGTPLLVTTSDRALDAALSPDGEEVAWSERGAGGRACLYVSTSFAGARTLVASGEGDARRPSFGKGCVAWEERSGGSRIAVTDLTTSRVTFVAEGASPSVSPDGEWIAFESGEPPSLFKVRPDGRDRTRLTERRDARRAAWSPDSRWIAFAQFTDGRADDIWAVRADGSRFLRITWDPAPEWDPCWAPDGRIFFTTVRNGRQEIRAADPENAELLK